MADETSGRPHLEVLQGAGEQPTTIDADPEQLRQLCEMQERQIIAQQVLLREYQAAGADLVELLGDEWWMKAARALELVSTPLPI